MNKQELLKLTVVLLSAFLLVLDINAQVTVRTEIGFPLGTDNDNIGFFVNIEPRVQVMKKAIAGVRIGVSVNSDIISLNQDRAYFIDPKDDNGLISLVPTFDYYLNEKKNRPFLGLGIGYCIFNDVDFTDRSNGDRNNLTVKTEDKVGMLIRGGLEIQNLRLCVEYNLVPEMDLKIPDGQTVGTIENSFVGISLGYNFGQKDR